MVNAPAIFATGFLFAQEAAEPVLERMKPDQRAAVIMALLGLTLIGLFMIIFVMVGGHWVRRLARHRPGQRGRSSRDAGPSDAQLRESLESILPEVKTDDTIQYGKSSPDTKIEG
jgi:cation transport ATPase